MDEALGKLIGGLALLCLVVYVAALVLVLALAAAAILAPPYGAFRWLRHLLTQRYTLSPAKKAQCFLLGAACLGLPFLIAPVREVHPLLPVWLGTTLSLSACSLFLVLEAYRQSIWPHSRVVWRAWQAAAQCRMKLWRTTTSSGYLQCRVRAREFTHGELLREYDRLDALVPALVQDSPAFLSAEQLRINRELDLLSTEALEARLDTLRSRLSATPQSDPSMPTLTLQAALARMTALARTIGTDRTVEWLKKRQQQNSLQAELTDLRARIQALRRQADDEVLAIRGLRKQRLLVA